MTCFGMSHEISNFREPLTPSPHQRPRVAIVGGGLAGIAAATVLAEHGFPVRLFESRPALGGRAGSYLDQQSAEVIDNCQHVSMGCCTHLRRLCQSLGIADQFQTQTRLYFVSPNGLISRFEADPVPAPFHLTRAFARLPYLTLREKWQFAWCVNRLARASTESLAGLSFATWLRDHGQPERLIRRVWDVVLVSALSESLDRIDAAYARKVFVDGFLANRTGWLVEIPTTTLSKIYGEHALRALRQRGVQVHCQSRVEQIHRSERFSELVLKNGERFQADEFVLAVPHHQIARLVPSSFHDHPVIEKLQKIETAPITSVHLWFDRQICDLPHAVFVERLSQWMFRRMDCETSADGRFRYQIVISASRNLKPLTQQQIIDEVIEDLSTAWPETARAKLEHARVITEQRAVFSVTPGIDDLRPAQQSPIENLQFAGDWTQTGWPATMEGAVRSGDLAAVNILRRSGIDSQIDAEELPDSWLSKLLFRLKR